MKSTKAKRPVVARKVEPVVGLRKFLRRRVHEIYEHGYICGFSEKKHFEEEVDIIIDWIRAKLDKAQPYG